MRVKTISEAAVALIAIATPVALAASPAADAWEIGPVVDGRNYSEGMPRQPAPGPGGSVMMDFPLAGRGQVDALTTAIGPLAGARQITMRYRIDAAPGARFVADETPGEPATVSLYFQRAGDDWSGTRRFASYRWYVPGQAVIPLAPGERTVTVALDDVWTNVNGWPRAQDPAGFAAALANTARLGIAFGSTSRRSHGVYATASARFTLLSLDIR